MPEEHLVSKYRAGDFKRVREISEGVEPLFLVIAGNQEGLPALPERFAKCN